MITYKRQKEIAADIAAAKGAEEKRKYWARVLSAQSESHFRLFLIRNVAEAQVTQEECDRLIAKLLGPRKRGDRTKLPGAIELERLARQIFKVRVHELKKQGLTMLDAKDCALGEIAPAFKISKSRLEYWTSGKAAAQRSRPIEERQFRKRKARKAAKSS